MVHCHKMTGIFVHPNHRPLIQLWVADLDFLAPPCIVEALKRALEEDPVFGYETLSKAYYSSLASWIRERHHVDWTSLGKAYESMLKGKTDDPSIAQSMILDAPST